MSQTNPQTPDAASLGTRTVAGAIATTAQFLVFDPGLFIVDMATPQSTPTDMGLRLPAIRLDMTPPVPARPGRAVVTGALTEGWMWRTDEPVFVLVTGGRVGMVLTIYRASTLTPPPEIRFRQIKTSLVDAAPAGAPQPTPPTDAASIPLTVLAHVRNTGDVTGPGGRWLGVAGSNAPIEGFAVTSGGELSPADIEYQAILGNSWNTPWFTNGEFCGSRGMLLPLLGVRVRLKGEAQKAFTIQTLGRFVGQPEPVTASDGEPCTAGEAPLEALQVVVAKRDTPPAETSPQPPADEPARPKAYVAASGRMPGKPRKPRK